MAEAGSGEHEQWETPQHHPRNQECRSQGHPKGSDPAAGAVVEAGCQQKGCAAAQWEGRGGFVWEELRKRDFSIPLLAKGQLPTSPAHRRRAPAQSRELSGAVPTIPSSTEGKTSPWIKRPCKTVLATLHSFFLDKDGRLVGLPPLSALVL